MSLSQEQSKHYRHPKQGVTLIEMMVAAALMAVVVFAAYQVFNRFSRQSKLAFDNTSQKIEEVILDRHVRGVVSNSHPSFNFLALKDDKDRNFYDYQSSSTCRIQCERTLTLSADSKYKSFVVLEAETRFPAQIFTPQNAYDVGDENSNEVSGVLNFDAAQNSNYLKTLFPDFAVTESENPNRYRLLMFTSFAELEALGVNFSRRSIYLGVLDGMNYSLSAINPENAFSIFHPHPSHSAIVFDDGGATTYGINGLDRFFRTLPPFGGSEAKAIVYPVRLLRYSFRAGSTPQIFVQDWDNKSNKWNTPGTLLGTDIESMTLTRKTISSPVIRVDLKRIYKK